MGKKKNYYPESVKKQVIELKWGAKEIHLQVKRESL